MIVGNVLPMVAPHRLALTRAWLIMVRLASPEAS